MWVKESGRRKEEVGQRSVGRKEEVVGVFGGRLRTCRLNQPTKRAAREAEGGGGGREGGRRKKNRSGTEEKGWREYRRGGGGGRKRGREGRWHPKSGCFIPLSSSFHLSWRRDQRLTCWRAAAPSKDLFGGRGERRGGAFVTWWQRWSGGGRWRVPAVRARARAGGGV